jgi:hypothetical protein
MNDTILHQNYDDNQYVTEDDLNMVTMNMNHLQLDHSIDLSRKMMKNLESDIDCLAYDYIITRDPSHLLEGHEPAWDLYNCGPITNSDIREYIYRNGLRWLSNRIHLINPEVDIDLTIVQQYLDFYLDSECINC